jgi:predicted anti-sigma-YlaC factor YlaD
LLSSTGEIVDRGNSGASGGDYLGMDCVQMRAAISADLDGEDLPVARAVLEQHLLGCPGCREYQTAADVLNRRVRLTPAPLVPNLTGRILGTIGDGAQPAPATQGLRLGVGVLGLLQLGLSTPALVLGSDAGLPVHQARHLGSFGVALAIGLLVAAWRPERIAGLLPLATVLVVCLVGSAIADTSTGAVAWTAEFPHLVEVLGLVGLWLLDRADRGVDPEISLA